MLSDSAEFVPRNMRERVLAPLLRLALQLTLRPKLAPEVPIAAQRRRIKQIGRLTRPRDVLVEPATVGGVPGEWLRLPGMTGGSILYFHGGGYCVGTAATHRVLTARLARACNMAVFAADYRLAPEHPYPAAEQDAVAACRALAAEGRLIVAGDSAGGGLALAAALAVRSVAGLVLFSPWIDLAKTWPPSQGDAMLSGAWLTACARAYLAGAPAPSLLDADLSGLPPVLIQAGGDEPLRDEAVRLHDALARRGVAVRCEIVPDRWHAFQQHAGWLPSADAALARAAAFIAGALKG